MTKFCKKCSTEKPLPEFHKDGRARDGLSVKCAECHAVIRAKQKTRAAKDYYHRHGASRHAASRAAWHERNPHKKFEYHKKKYETAHGRAWHLWVAAKKRKPGGFTLTLEHVAAQIKNGVCPITGALFDLKINKNREGRRSFTPYAPSLDKIDPKQGYTNENTRVVIFQYNVMKGELSDAELVELCKIVVARAAA